MERAKVLELVQNMDREALKRVVACLDGHSIFHAEGLVAEGLPQEVADFFTREHKSDGSHKGTIFTDEGAVASLRGIYGLELLGLVADALGADTSDAYRKIGRGFRAQSLKKAISEAM